MFLLLYCKTVLYLLFLDFCNRLQQILNNEIQSFINDRKEEASFMEVTLTESSLKELELLNLKSIAS